MDDDRYERRSSDGAERQMRALDKTKQLFPQGIVNRTGWSFAPSDAFSAAAAQTEPADAFNIFQSIVHVSLPGIVAD
jgi:hypothetical protein